VYRRITAAALSALFALNAYRAATLSFTTDEAFSYQLFIGAPRFELLRTYDANLHLLHTFLVWASVKSFGLSELAFRLPSLAACALYFTGVYRLSGLMLGPGAMSLLGALALSVNPLILDHMAVGRGYGLALACYAWAFGEAVRAVRDPGRGLFRVAVWMALSVASNLTFLFPCAGLAAALMLWRPRLPRRVGDLAGPAGVFTFLLLALPLSRMEPGQFYFGSRTVTEMTQTLAEMSVGGRHLNANWVNAGASALLATAAAVAIARWKRGGAVALAAATLALTAAGVAASHWIFGLPLPWGRTGLYFLFLAPLFATAWLEQWPAWPRRAGAGIAALAILAMAVCMAPRYFKEWPSDAGARAIMTRIHELRNGRTRARIAASPPVNRTLALYRDMFGMDWVAEIAADPFAPGCDFYVLRDGDRERAGALRVILAGMPGGTVLAIPAAAPPSGAWNCAQSRTDTSCWRWTRRYTEGLCPPKSASTVSAGSAATRCGRRWAARKSTLSPPTTSPTRKPWRIC
jgi:hypothetical protein